MPPAMTVEMAAMGSMLRVAAAVVPVVSDPMARSVSARHSP